MHKDSSSSSHIILDSQLVEGNQFLGRSMIRGSALDFEECSVKSLARSLVEMKSGFEYEYFSSVVFRIYSPLHKLRHCQIMVFHRSSRHLGPL